MRELIIGGRTITVSHIETEATEYGDIQRYRIDLTGSDAVTHLSSLRSSPNVDARVMASVIDTELLLGYEGSAESGLLRDSGIRAWRDPKTAPLLEQTLDRLRDEMKDLPPEPVSDVERLLLRAFDIDGDDEVHDA